MSWLVSISSVPYIAQYCSFFAHVSFSFSLVFEAAQPALLYLVPACLGSSLLCAVVRGELKELFAYSEEEEEEAEESDEKKDEKTKKDE